MEKEKYVLPKVKNVGKPYAGKPHVRFDEEGLVNPALYSTEHGPRCEIEGPDSIWAFAMSISGGVACIGGAEQ